MHNILHQKPSRRVRLTVQSIIESRRDGLFGVSPVLLKQFALGFWAS